MDPDETLAELRQAITDWAAASSWRRRHRAPARSLAEDEAGERATSAASALDDWLSKGGALPAAWAGSP